MTDHEVAYLSAKELVERYSRRDLSPREVASLLLERIDEVDPALNAYCHIDRDATVAWAAQSERRYQTGETRSPLDGVPVAVKDVFLTAGWPTRRGSRTIDPAGPWVDDAPAVARLRDAGAVLIGKTTTPELGWKAVTDSPLTGVTRNPWNTALTPGGSSGGSGAALAAGMAPLALGTDGGGSIRIPAAFCGVVGMKPTYGRVPVWPPSAFGVLSHAGPMARTVEDAALLLDVIGFPDHRDPACLPAPEASFTESLRAGLGGLTVAHCGGWGVAAAAEIDSATRGAAAALEGEGAVVEEVPPLLEDPVSSFLVLWEAGAARALARLTPEERGLVDPGLLLAADNGTRWSASDYLEALSVREAVAATLSQLSARYHVILTPAVPVVAFEVGVNAPSGFPAEWPGWTPLTYPFNMSGQPALVLPAATGSSGLPIGVQLVGARHDDAVVLQAAQALETALGLSLRPPRGR